MLKLLGVPQWAVDGQPGRLLPATAPGCLLIYLAVRADWLDRDHLSDFFWPDTPAAQAQRKLRVTLHRMLALLKAWGRGADLLRERTRLRLLLPCDVHDIAQATAGRLLAMSPQGCLQGFRVADLSAFDDWADRQGRHWRRDWALAATRALASPAAGDDGAALQALREAVLRLRDAPDGADLTDAIGLLPLPLEAGPLRPGGPAGPAAGPSSWPAGVLPIGRADDVAWLRRHTASVAVLLAEAGAGKSTVLRAAAPSGLWLVCREGQAGVPFAPVLDSLRAGAAELRAAARQPGHALHPYRLDLARLQPEWAPGEALPPLDAHTAKARLFEALASVFDTVARPLLVDDLQWCDAATLELLVFCAHRARPLWWAAARGHELPSATRQVLAALREAGCLQTRDLASLSPADVAAVCHRRWPLRTWTAPVLDALARASAGNPFVLEELVAVDADRSAAFGTPIKAPQRVQALVQRRVDALSPAAREALQAAAVLARPVSPALLRDLAQTDDEATFFAGCDEALRAELLAQAPAGLQCRHDLIRQAVMAGLGPARRVLLHRRAALSLAARGHAEPLDIAAHWQAGDEPQTALTWLHRGAQRSKDQGRFDAARELWLRVATESLDAAQALRARLALAECDLLDDLPRGRAALQDLLAATAAVADNALRVELEAQALAGLVDNAVFAGDLVAAAAWAVRLRAHLPDLRAGLRRHALEVLIELNMRLPDIAAAWACLAQIRQTGGADPAALSFEGQIHWFEGDVRAARDAFERLLERHPDYCQGLTLENDLAVMLNALGDYPRAETMARRSLVSWRDVAHTQTLSLLVLGAVLTNTGRLAEADEALSRALALARQQASAGFEAEAQVRLARLRLHGGDTPGALLALGAARPLLQHSREPLRVASYVLYHVLAQSTAGQVPDDAEVDRLRTVVGRSRHPQVRCQWARVQAEQAWAAGRCTLARRLLARAMRIARDAGLAEPLGSVEAGLGRVNRGR